MLFKNPFKKIDCEICNTRHDAFASSCPECGNKNTPRGDITPFEEDRILGPGRELACFFTGWLSLELLGYVLVLVFNAFGFTSENPLYLSTINYTVYGLLLIFLVAITAPKLRSLFSRFLTKDTTKGFLVFLAIFIFDIVWGNILLRLGGTTNENQEAVNQIVDTSPLLSVLFIGIIGPFCEEITYRAGLFTFLKRINKVLAFVGTAIFFGAIHMHDITSLNEWLSLPTYVFAGFAFSYAYDKWGIGASLTAHITINTVAVLLELL